MSPTRIGTLVTLGELGTGAGSRVYRVRREADSLEYALKEIVVLRPSHWKYLEQARNEFRVARLLDHPNLMKVYAIETRRDWLFRTRLVRLLAEFAPGTTLDQHPPLRADQLIQTFERVADALAHMHARGVCHADLKPRNVILGPAGEVKVIDFGLARVEGEQRHRLQGTVEYMAPETVARKLVSPHTDTFNFGATFYRVATQRHLPTWPPGMVPDERSYRRAVVPVARLNPALPAELCDIIHWCIEYRPECRPGQIAEVRVALAELARARGIAPPG